MAVNRREEFYRKERKGRKGRKGIYHEGHDEHEFKKDKIGCGRLVKWAAVGLLLTQRRMIHAVRQS